jgi:hypothetical protein
MNPKFSAAVREAFPDRANIVLDIIRGGRDYALTFKAAAQRDRESYHPHDTYVLKLEALNEVLDGCGVEYVEAGRGRKSPAFEYVNFGDTYDTTIVYFPDRRTWRVTSWGDIVENGNYA